MPTAEQLLDTATVTRALRAFVADTAVETPVVIAIHFDPSGTSARPYLLTRGSASESAIELTNTVFATVKPQLAAPTPWGVRIRLAPGPQPTMAVERSLRCAPRSITPPSGGPMIAPTAVSDRVIDRTTRVSHWVLLVSADGTVLEATPVEQQTDTDFEARQRDYFRKQRYAPGTLDGIPVAMIDTVLSTTKSITVLRRVGP